MHCVLGFRVGEKHPRVIWAGGYRKAGRTVLWNSYTRLAKTQGSSDLYGPRVCWFQGRFPSVASIWAAARRLKAAIVSVGLAVAEVGNTADPTMNRFGGS